MAPGYSGGSVGGGGTGGWSYTNWYTYGYGMELYVDGLRSEEYLEKQAYIRQAKLPRFYILNTKTFMGKVNALVRRLFDKDVKTLMEAGYVSDDFELTEKGKTELLSLLFMNHKAELVKEANKEIEEKKAEKK